VKARLGARAASLIACGDPPLPEPQPFERAGQPSFAQVWQIATHNSYWVDRGAQGDAFAGGTSERWLDQLLYDRARALGNHRASGACITPSRATAFAIGSKSA
jgi:hypothetical protein